MIIPVNMNPQSTGINASLISLSIIKDGKDTADAEPKYLIYWHSPNVNYP